MVKTNILNLDRITLFWAAVGIFLLAIFTFSFYPLSPSREELRLVIDYGDGASRTFVTSYRNGTTAWDLLQQANASYQIALEAEADFRPRTIGDFKNGAEGKKWILYVDGRKQETSPLEARLSGGEIIRFRFE